MRLRRIPQAISFVDEHALVIKEQTAPCFKGRWHQVFEAYKPLHLEIGTGQGHFLQAASTAYPEHNYLGMERRAEPLLWLLKRLCPPYPPNLRILHAEAARLTDIFAAGEINTLYLFFPDPWPKSRHAKRRLTAPAFIREYQQILEPAGRLIFKTDGAAFYRWSCDNFKEAGWCLAKVGEGLPLKEGEFITGYERRFRDLGLPIYHAEFVLP